MEESPAAPKATRTASFGSRRKAGRRTFVNIPGLARRGRTTLRHFVLLLLGGYVSWVEQQRRRGLRGLLFQMRAGAAWVCRRFIDPEIAALPFPVQLRRRLEMLGPTYIKLGQILSLRLDILPEVVTEELRNLLSRLPPVPFEEIVEIVERDLGRPLDRMFVEVDAEPLGSASIAQSHRARLAGGEQVLLKVVKPGIRELLNRDTELLRMVGMALQLLIPRYQPRRVIEEFCDYTLREADMTREAENSETFQANFKDMPDIVFPGIFSDYSGEQVLCMDYLEGHQPDSEAVQKLSRDERQRLIDLGAVATLRMLYEDGFFHADLHPGNMLILPGTRIGFIDLGMVGRLDPALRQSLLNLFYSLVMEDFEGAARHLSDVAQLEPNSDVVGFRRAVREIGRRWRRDATFEEFSLAMLILEATQLGARYHLYFPVEMVLMVKALVTYEGMGYLMDQDFNVAEVSQRHIGRIFRHRFSPRSLLREGARLAPDLLDAVSRLPLLIGESQRFLEQRTRKQPASPLRGVRATIFGGFCLLSGAILAAFDGPWPVWVVLLFFGIVMSLRRGD